MVETHSAETPLHKNKMGQTKTRIPSCHNMQHPSSEPADTTAQATPSLLAPQEKTQMAVRRHYPDRQRPLPDAQASTPRPGPGTVSPGRQRKKGGCECTKRSKREEKQKELQMDGRSANTSAACGFRFLRRLFRIKRLLTENQNLRTIVLLLYNCNCICRVHTDSIPTNEFSNDSCCSWSSTREPFMRLCDTSYRGGKSSNKQSE